MNFKKFLKHLWGVFIHPKKHHKKTKYPTQTNAHPEANTNQTIIKNKPIKNLQWADYVKKKRKSKHLTCGELSELTKIDPIYITLIEEEGFIPSIYEVVKIAESLECDIEECLLIAAGYSPQNTNRSSTNFKENDEKKVSESLKKAIEETVTLPTEVQNKVARLILIYLNALKKYRESKQEEEKDFGRKTPTEKLPCEEKGDKVEHIEHSEEKLEEDLFKEEPKQKHKPYRKKSPTRKAKVKSDIQTPHNIAKWSQLYSKASPIFPKNQTPYVKVNPPFVEFDIEDAKVYLKIPRQIIDVHNDFSKDYLEYIVQINNTVEKISANVIRKKDIVYLEEVQREIEKPLQALYIKFPPEFENRVNQYKYKFNENCIYAFTPTGEYTGRLYFHAIDPQGNIAYFPQRDLWVLLHEDYTIEPEAYLEEEVIFWQNYKLLFLDLENTNNIYIKRNLEHFKTIPCNLRFSIESADIIYDDFGKLSPILTNKDLKIISSIENSQGWKVWLQGRKDHTVISTNWTGTDPLCIDLERELSQIYGYFQIDICDQEDRRIKEIFFRYIPSFTISHIPKIIIPNKEGHKIEEIEITLADSSNWHISSKQNFEKTPEGYRFFMPPYEDLLQFSLMYKNIEETQTEFSVTLPRLKWRSSKDLNWHHTPIHLKYADLKAGEDLTIYICDNLKERYRFSLFLEKDDKTTQRGNFKHKKHTYFISLNQFFDTIKHEYRHWHLNLKISHHDSKRSLPIVEIESPFLLCKFCNFKSKNADEICKHIIEKHIDEVTTHLSVMELEREGYKIPRKIYKCIQCDQCSEKQEDIIKKHAHETGHPPGVRIIKDPAKIIHLMYPHLLKFRKCKLCGYEPSNLDLEISFLNHLMSHHKNELYTVEGE